MKHTFLILAAISLTATLLTGCSTTKPSAASPNRMSRVTRNNCYSLLHQLLAEQKDVSLLRFIKSEPANVKDLVNRIATTSGAGAKLLEEFAKTDPSLRLDAYRLPPGEQATRDAIAATKQKELLGRSGDEFELTLLLTQTEALSYAAHLAQVASANEPRADHARDLTRLSYAMSGLDGEVYRLLLAKTRSAANPANDPQN